MKYSKFAHLIICSLLTLLLGLIVVAQDQMGELVIKPHVFETSKKEKVDAEFGRLMVAENRKKNNGKMIEIAFVRFKSTSKNPGPPIVYLAGGPGGSGIQSAKYGRFELFMAMRQFGDVIALDQRGTGESKPNLKCGGNIDLPMDASATSESVVKEERDKAKACADDWRAKGVDVSAFNTVESAGDINDLRKALGAKKVTLWGISYGTHLALATIRQYGKHIDRAILAGVEGVDDTYKLPSYTQNVMVALDKRVKTDTVLSKKVPDFLGLIKTVHDRFDKNPVIVELTDPKTKQKTKVAVGKFDLQYLFAAFSGSNEAQSIMPKLYYDMSRGDFTFVAQQMARFRKGGVSSIMSIAMDCASGISKERLARIEKEKKTALFSDAVNVPFPGICGAVNVPDLGNEFRKPVISSVPVLFISGTLDGRTPASNAEFAMKGLKNSSHLIIDGAGHSDPLFLSSPKIAETMFDFMKGEKLPKTINIEMEKPFKFSQIKDIGNATGPAGGAKLAKNIRKTLDKKVPVWQNELNVPNVGVGLIENGKIISAKVYGKSAPKNMLFNVASITKAVFATLVMRLVQEGEWKLDEPLYHYFVDLDVKGDARHRKLTTRHVLSQQSGFVNWRRNHPSKKLTFDFEPGNKFNYSGEGMEYLRKAIESKFKRSLSEIAAEKLFKPNAMRDTFHSWDGKRDIERFSGWYDSNGKEHKVDYSTDDNAADDLMTTIEAFSTFGVSVLNGAVLSSEHFNEMVKTQAEINPNLQQGLGWRVVNNLPNDEFAIQHGGNDIGVATIIVLLPKSKRGVIVFTNGDNGLIVCNNIVRESLPEGAEIIHKSYKSTDIKDVPKIVEVGDKVLKSYEGVYVQPSGRELSVSKKANSILIQMAGIPNLTLYPETSDTFFLLDFDTKLKFTKDKAGNVDAVLMIEGENVIRCVRKDRE